MLSIIIATYNRCEFLRNALDSLADQSLQKDHYEIIVVNNNSTDQTEKVVLDFTKKNPYINLFYMVEMNQGLSFARNRGIKESTGEIISFIDDDAIAHHDYCLNLITNAGKFKEFDAFGGKVIPFYEGGKEPEWLSEYVWGMVAKVDLGEQIKPFDKKYPVGCNMAFRRVVFGVVGLFNTDLQNRCDDKDIFNRLRSAKFKVLYLPDVAVNHYIPLKRTSVTGLRNLAILSGMEERIMFTGKPFKIITKFISYSLKIAAAIILGMYFCVKGNPKKALLINIMFWSLMGFIKNPKKTT